MDRVEVRTVPGCGNRLSVLLRAFLACMFCATAPLGVLAADRYGNHSAADFERHVRALKKKLPDEGFTIVVTPPFVVIGDESPEEVRGRSEDTVAMGRRKLKAAYFEKDPPEILDIWLFKDKESYEENAKKLFHTKPDTPYGYYSAADKALVMNISTGGGTLVHEIVHPFVAANFPVARRGSTRGSARSTNNAAKRTAKSTAIRTGACRACKRPSAKSRCRPSKPFARQAAMSSTSKTGGPTTPRPDTSATTCNSKGC